MITYKEVIEKGFVFDSITIPKNIKTELKSLTFYPNEDKQLGKEVSWSTFGMPPYLNQFFIKQLYTKVDLYLQKLLDRLETFEAYKTDKNEYVELHTDNAFGGLVQIMIYYIEKDMKGRDFLYGTKNDIKKITPYTGLVIICDQINKEWLHGTTPLLSDTFNLCITGITPR